MVCAYHSGAAASQVDPLGDGVIVSRLSRYEDPPVWRVRSKTAVGDRDTRLPGSHRGFSCAGRPHRQSSGNQLGGSPPCRRPASVPSSCQSASAMDVGEQISYAGGVLVDDPGHWSHRVGYVDPETLFQYHR